MKPAKKKGSRISIDAKKFNKLGQVVTVAGAGAVTGGATLGTINLLRGRKFGKTPAKLALSGVAGIVTGTAMRAYSAKKYKQIKKGSKRK